MAKPFENYAISTIPAIVAKCLEVSEDQVILGKYPQKSGEGLILQVGEYSFKVEYRSSSAKAPLFMAHTNLLQDLAKNRRKEIPLIAVPYMGDAGRLYCQEHGLSWLDLSGNAHIRAPGLFVHVEGRPNRFKSAGRPQDIFAPKSSRVVRYLLLNPDQRFTQRELSQKTGVDEGHTSRIVRRLEQERLVDRDENGALRPLDANELLEAWYDVYDFGQHHIDKGHIAARSGETLLYRMADVFTLNAVDYAATGFGAAWLYSHFAKFRLTTFYFRHPPTEAILESLNFRKDERGANIWLVVPKDEGVFHGSEVYDGIPCVHPIQVYLDLKGHPERASEAASKLRQDCLNWKRHD